METMSMSCDTPNTQPWQVFHAANKHLGSGVVAKIFNREVRSAQSWAQDPACTQHRCQSPLETLHNLFLRLDTVGMGYVVRAALRYLESTIAPVDPAPHVEPKPTLDAEVLADYAAVADLQRVIRDGEALSVVVAYKQAALDEIERTFAKYCQERRG